MREDLPGVCKKKKRCWGGVPPEVACHWPGAMAMPVKAAEPPWIYGKMKDRGEKASRLGLSRGGSNAGNTWCKTQGSPALFFIQPLLT